jgi:hypothetical protein
MAVQSGSEAGTHGKAAARGGWAGSTAGARIPPGPAREALVDSLLAAQDSTALLLPCMALQKGSAHRLRALPASQKPVAACRAAAGNAGTSRMRGLRSVGKDTALKTIVQGLVKLAEPGGTFGPESLRCKLGCVQARLPGHPRRAFPCRATTRLDRPPDRAYIRLFMAVFPIGSNRQRAAAVPREKSSMRIRILPSCFGSLTAFQIVEKGQ